jgi:hypothetical protein
MSILRVTSGDAYTGVRRLVITVTDDAGATVDLTGTDLRFVVKRRRSDANDDALIDEVPTLASPQSGATKGVAYIALAEADTADLAGRYYWELEADDSVGIITLASGRFYVTADLIEGA